MADRTAGAAPARLVAVLGPTNTGKTHYAVERMLGHASGMIGLPAAPAGAGGVRPHRQAARRPCGGADHRRGEDRPAAGDLLRLHRRGHAAGLRGRVPGGGRDPALRRPVARPRLHRPAAARPRQARDPAPGRPHRRAADPPAVPGGGVRHPRALLHPELPGLQEAHAPAAPHRRRRLQRGERLRHRRVDPPPAGRGGGGDGIAEPAHAQRAGPALPGGRGRLPGGHRRHRNGPEHGRRPRGLRGAAQVRRQAHALAHAPGDRPDRRARRALHQGRQLRRHRRRAGDGRRPGRSRGRPPLPAAGGRRVAQRAAGVRLATRPPAQPRQAAAAGTG